MSGFEPEGTRKLVCPYCYKDFKHTYDLAKRGDVKCQSCDRVFHYEKEVVIQYYSTRKEVKP